MYMHVHVHVCVHCIVCVCKHNIINCVSVKYDLIELEGVSVCLFTLKAAFYLLVFDCFQ